MYGDGYSIATVLDHRSTALTETKIKSFSNLTEIAYWIRRQTIDSLFLEPVSKLFLRVGGTAKKKKKPQVYFFFFESGLEMVGRSEEIK